MSTGGSCDNDDYGDDNVDDKDNKNDDDDDRHGSCLIADERCQLEAADSGCEAPLKPQLWPIRPQQNEFRKYFLFFLQRSRSRKMPNDKKILHLYVTPTRRPPDGS